MAALPLISVIGTAIGAGTQVYSAVQQSKDAQAAAEFKEKFDAG